MLTAVETGPEALMEEGPASIDTAMKRIGQWDYTNEVFDSPENPFASRTHRCIYSIPVCALVSQGTQMHLRTEVQQLLISGVHTRRSAQSTTYLQGLHWSFSLL